MHHFKAPHDLFSNAARYDDYLEDVHIPEPENLYDQPGEFAGSVATRGVDDALIGAIGAGVTKRCNTWELGRRLGVDVELNDPDYGRVVYQRFLKRYLRCVKGSMTTWGGSRLSPRRRDAGQYGDHLYG